MERTNFVANWSRKMNCKYFHIIGKGANYSYYLKNVRKGHEVYAGGIVRFRIYLESVRLVKLEDIIFETLADDTILKKPMKVSDMFRLMDGQGRVCLLLFRCKEASSASYAALKRRITPNVKYTC